MPKKLCSYRLDINTVQLVHEIKETLNLKSDSDVLRFSLKFLNEVQNNQNEGGELIFRLSDGTSKSLIFI